MSQLKQNELDKFWDLTNWWVQMLLLLLFQVYLRTCDLNKKKDKSN